MKFIKNAIWVKLTSSIILYMLCGNTFAQIPNAGFENWNYYGGYSNPVGWATMNHTTAQYSLVTAYQGSPGHPGSYFLALYTTYLPGSIKVPGIAVSGVLDTLSMAAKSGFPFTQRPQNLIGSINYQDGARIKSLLTKWNATFSRRDTIAFFDYQPNNSCCYWQPFIIYYNYMSQLQPDSCIIELRSNSPADFGDGNLLIDNLAFSGSADGIGENSLTGNYLRLYPNPVSDKLYIETTIEGGKISIQNMFSQTLLDGMKLVKVIDVSTLPKGIYLITVANFATTKIIKFIKE